MNLRRLRYAISDRNFARKVGFVTPAEQARKLALAGVEFYQLREKDLSAAELAKLTRQVLEGLTGTPTCLLLNHRADIAAAVGAHGVHLTASPHELTVRQVRQVYAAANMTTPVVSISCHSLDDVTRLLSDPPTMILFGPVFGKTVGGDLVVGGLGLALLRKACRLAAPLPVFALGGVTDENMASCLECGAAGTAGIRLFQQAPASAARIF